MTYREFCHKYEALLSRLIAYAPDTAGHNICAGELADLCEAYPEFEARYDA